MNKITKVLLAAIILMVASVSFYVYTNMAYCFRIIEAPEFIGVKIGINVSQKQLADLQSMLKQNYDIDISFEGSRFSDEGRLKSMNMKVDTNDGFSGAVTARPIQLLLQCSGFYRNYREGAEHQFDVGRVRMPE